jgi:DNA-directed RNA polymerase subunit RPC12/RpoP
METKVYKCGNCENTFLESEMKVFNTGKVICPKCDSDDVIELKEIHSRTNWAYIDRCFREGMNDY